MHNSSEPTNESEALVRYLRLDFDLSALYAKWSQSDANFREKAAQCGWVWSVGVVCAVRVGVLCMHT